MMMMLIEAIDDKDNIDDDDDGDNNDNDDDGEGRLVAALAQCTCPRPPSTASYAPLLSHNATLSEPQCTTMHHCRATMHHNAPLSGPQCNTGRKCSWGFLQKNLCCDKKALQWLRCMELISEK